MSELPRMRPTFEIRLESDGEAVLRTLGTMLTTDAAGLEGQALPRHAVLQLAEPRRSWLSPFLNLELSGSPGAERLKGRFSPHPNVWTGFMAVYGLLAMGGLVTTMFGISQWSIDETPWMLLGAPVSIGLVAFVYGAAVIGQGLTADEMYELRAFVDRAIRETPAAGQGTEREPSPATLPQ